MLGREWGNYVVDGKLGEGGMGTVYRLVHRSLPDTYAALKVLNARGAAVASAKERFDQEARVAAAIGRDRVARVLDQGQFPDGVPYIVMEFIVGQSLDQHLDETGPLRALTALQVTYHIADTLAIAHAKGIIHRDVKPSNIMLTRTRNQEFAVTILDWGIARARGEYQVAQTETSAIAGTLGYMAPEIVRRGGTVDGRSDVFSLGVVLYKLLSGVLPFPALTSEDQIPAFIASRPPAIGQNRPPSLDSVPRWLERIVLRALAPLREDRPTMDALREDLGQAIARLRESPDNQRDQPPHEEPLQSESHAGQNPDADATRMLPRVASDAESRTARIAEPLTRRGSNSKRRLRMLMAGLLLLAFLVVGVGHWLRTTSGGVPAAARTLGPALPTKSVSTVTAQPPQVADPPSLPPTETQPNPPSGMTAGRVAQSPVKPTAGNRAPAGTGKGTGGARGNDAAPKIRSSPARVTCHRTASGALDCD